MMPTRHDNQASPRPRAFTIMELMVAVAVIITLTILTVPTFRSLKANLDASSAQNTLSVVLNQARNMAMRDDRGDTAVVFLYDREKQLYSLIVTSLRIQGLPDPGDPFGNIYDVFAPIEGTRQRNLPPGWEVRGLAYGAKVAPPNSPRWYDHTANFGADGADTAWIFPESDRNFEVRQTFMVRFAARTGTVVTANEQFKNQDALVYLDPTRPFDTLANYDWAGELNVEEDAVFLRGTPALSLYSVEELATRLIEVDVDPGTGTLYSMNYGDGVAGNGSYLADAIYQAADGSSERAYDALFYYLDENTDPIVFNRFTGMIMRNLGQ
jgi:type II secretory pathway pseudopilin PulG